jgi:hypothetical protein
MRLKNAQGEELEITVAGYEFSKLDFEIPPDEDTLNWLNIILKAKHSQGTWTATSACLQTWELADLIQWFEQIAGNSADKGSVSFIEPCLNFQIIAKSPPIVQISMSAEFRPPWIKGFWDSVSMDFSLDSDTATVIVNSLRAQLAQYPERAEGTGTTSVQD